MELRGSAGTALGECGPRAKDCDAAQYKNRAVGAPAVTRSLRNTAHSSALERLGIPCYTRQQRRNHVGFQEDVEENCRTCQLISRRDAAYIAAFLHVVGRRPWLFRADHRCTRWA